MSFTPPGPGMFIARRPVNLRRILLALYLLLLAVFLAAAGAWFVEAHAEYRQLKLAEAVQEQKLNDAKRRLAEQQKILERLRTDPAFVEKVIRQQLGYARPGEVIFRFEN